MADFQLPDDLMFNRSRIEDPAAYAKERAARSWLFIVGDEFASMPGGMSYAQVQQAVEHSARVASDPPRVLNLDLARQHVEALDALPRPTLVSCRTGPRASAVAYMYAGLKAGAAPADVPKWVPPGAVWRGRPRRRGLGYVGVRAAAAGPT